MSDCPSLYIRPLAICFTFSPMASRVVHYLKNRGSNGARCPYEFDKFILKHYLRFVSLAQGTIASTTFYPALMKEINRKIAAFLKTHAQVQFLLIVVTRAVRATVAAPFRGEVV
jgi:hypothetical protein